MLDSALVVAGAFILAMTMRKLNYDHDYNSDIHIFYCQNESLSKNSHISRCFSQYFLSLYFSPDGELICPSLDEEEEYYDDYYGGQEDEECVEDANVQVMVRRQ